MKETESLNESDIRIVCFIANHSLKICIEPKLRACKNVPFFSRTLDIFFIRSLWVLPTNKLLLHGLPNVVSSV